MNSMTGFGQAAADLARHRVTVTVRGVNHRNLDIAIRVREELRDLEPALRQGIADRVRRGRVEMVVELTRRDDSAAWPMVNREALAAVRAATRVWVEDGLLPQEPTTSDLLRWPELFGAAASGGSGASLTESDREAVATTAGVALDEFARRRAQEGAALRRLCEERLDELAAVATALRARRPEALADTHAALRKRLDELLAGAGMDPARVAQEAAVLADRSDVQEELDRLTAHLEHAREVFQEPAPGKRLDFMAQEIFRELNTLGTKSRDLGLIRLVLDAKVACEQLREQLQNVE